jgi:hypothetical protein
VDVVRDVHGNLAIDGNVCEQVADKIHIATVVLGGGYAA